MKRIQIHHSCFFFLAFIMTNCAQSPSSQGGTRSLNDCAQQGASAGSCANGTCTIADSSSYQSTCSSGTCSTVDSATSTCASGTCLIAESSDSNCSSGTCSASANSSNSTCGLSGGCGSAVATGAKNYSKGMQWPKSDPLSFYFEHGSFENDQQLNEFFIDSSSEYSDGTIMVSSFYGFNGEDGCLSGHFPEYTRSTYMLGEYVSPENVASLHFDGAISLLDLAKVRVRIGEAPYKQLIEKIYQCNTHCALEVVQAEYGEILQEILTQ